MEMQLPSMGHLNGSYAKQGAVNENQNKYHEYRATGAINFTRRLLSQQLHYFNKMLTCISSISVFHLKEDHNFQRYIGM